ncbi:RNB domain-containing ribonuclease [Angustibacter sp. McL0619]|uniref:RNB domain-containing ribonuclease n=1 Tax=Angustibacter sp. McL0619 TaxID=3415676 RepID=UPI003CF2BA96
MIQRRLRLRDTAGAAPVLDDVFAAIRDELGLPEQFAPEVELAAADAVRAPRLPDRDLSDLPFFTLDPPGSPDLDQAMHLEPTRSGYRVRYAIADLTAFVEPGGVIDAEARRRGQTLYSPDRRTPLHPTSISEEAGSLLPGQLRPAYVWDLALDPEGELRSADVVRAMVRSVDRLDEQSAAALEQAGDPRIALLREIGQRRLRLEAERGGASLPMPEQEVVREDDHYEVRLRPPSMISDWNAQISLMTGMAAADIMLAGQVGVLRTMPPPSHHSLARFRRQAQVLGARWPAEQQYGVFLRSLDRDDPHQLALIHEAAALFRGAGYTPFDGDVPEVTEHAAVADQYAHVTAPLRRLVDRFGLVVCEALCRDKPVPGWVREGLEALPALMNSSDQQANRLDHACTDAVEAAVLAPRVGEAFEGVVVDLRDKGPGGIVQLRQPPVLAPVSGDVQLGATLRVRLVKADVGQRRVEFTPV